MTRLRPRSRRTHAIKTANKKKTGSLIVIGGKEDKEGDRVILQEVARRTGRKKLVVVTAASQIPFEIWEDYRKLFHDFEIKNVEHLYIKDLESARDKAHLKTLKDAHTVFFSGGDQLRLTTKIGGTDLFHRICDIYLKEAGLLVGTSAGATAMGETMLIGNEAGESHKVGNWKMAPGFSLLKEVTIDQHFAQRGRIGRLLGAVAMNPGVLGIGIDEDTSIIVEGTEFQVLGSNAVYVVDGHYVTHTNISEEDADKTMSMHDVRLHILCSGQGFDIEQRRPHLEVN